MTIFQRYVRAMVWFILRLLYRVRVRGQHNIPRFGAAVLTPNHVSYLDAVLIAAHIRRPIRYAMHYRLYRRFRWVVEPMGAFPIAGKSENEPVYHEAFRIMEATLQRGEILCIFPEGRITTDGQLGEFRPGLRKLLDRAPAAVIPVGLCNLWGSYFSKRKPGLFKLPDHFMALITVRVGPSLPATAEMTTVRDAVAGLLSN